MNSKIETILQHLPKVPGCYLMLDQVGTVIYVGKAKNLEKRVKSYFQKAHNGKTARLVSDIEDINFITVETEAESLILENNLIKEHMPKYNILLKDGKSYPYLAITLERHPRIIFTRNAKRKFKAIFGPFPSVREARITFDLLNRLFKLRKCDHIPKDVCLYYHIGQCYAPCIKQVEKAKYEQDIAEVINVLKGNISPLTKSLEREMEHRSEGLMFEQAAVLRDTINALKATVTQTQHIDIKDRTMIDVIGVFLQHSWLSINVLHVRDGKIVSNRQNLIEINDVDVDNELNQYIYRFYESKNVVIPKEIIINNFDSNRLLSDLLQVKITTPIRGDKQHLLSLANENAKQVYEKEIALSIAKEETNQKLQQTLCAIFSINRIETIEMVDISNFGDESIVGGVVQFNNLEPNKRGYRFYKIKQTHQDDFKAMREVITRRFKRLIAERKPFPDLFIVDGGKQHVNICRDVFKELDVEIPFCGLSKDEKHKTNGVIFYQDDEMVEFLLTTNEVGRFLTRIQDEVHRFTINYMKKNHVKSIKKTELEEIPGVGLTYRRRLLQEFHSSYEVANASLQSLEVVLPKNIAKNVYDFYLREDKE